MPSPGFSSWIDRVTPLAITGSIVRLDGSRVTVRDFPVPIGAEVAIEREPLAPLAGEVIGIDDRDTIVMPFGHPEGLRRHQRVRLTRSLAGLRVGPGLLGRLVDARGRLIDHRPGVTRQSLADLSPAPIDPLTRPPVDTVFPTGLRVIDGLLTCGEGQRIGIFAGSGVGKSTLMGQLVRGSSADVVVVVLVGERGREVREFVERDLGEEGRKKSVVVIATGDEPAPLRVRAAKTGTSIAEYFRDTGKRVLLLMDSVTRFALALREIGLAAGEPPTTRGYPPGVFAELPRLLERTGRAESGSITAFYTVLVEGDDTNEPLSDAVRGILDGHIHLTRKLAERGHWPALDPLASISRCMPQLIDPAHASEAAMVRRVLAAHRDAEDLIEIGAYRAGSNPDVDLAVAHRSEWLGFLRQAADLSSPWETTRQKLHELAARFQAAPPSPNPAPNGGER